MAMSTDGDSCSSSSNQDNSDESPLELSYESSPFGSEGDSSPEGVHPEPLTTISGSDTGESDSSEDSSPRLLNLNW